MSRTTKNFYFPLILSLLLLLSGLAGCAPAADVSTPLSIGVAIYDQDDTFIATITQSIEKLARESETSVDYKINLTVVDGQTNQTLQIEQINTLIENGADILFVNIVDRTAAAVIIDNAKNADTPIVFFNREPVREDLVRWEHAYYVGAQAMESGIMQGTIVADLWQDNSEEVDKNDDGVLQYIMLEGEPGHQDALLRTRHAITPLSSANIPVEMLDSASANWRRGEATTFVLQCIEQFGIDIEVVFANNDDMALGAIDAYTQEGFDLENMPIIVGIDAVPQALEAIEQGTMQGTVLNDGEGMAQNMINLALAYHEDTPAGEAAGVEDGHYVWLPYRPVTPENASEFMK